MAFFALLLSLWLGLSLLSQFACREALRSGRYRAVLAFALAFAGMGVMHLLAPHRLTYMIDGLLPFPTVLVLISGLLELALGMLIVFPAYRRRAAWGAILLLVLMFPANIHVALRNLPAPGGLPAEPWYVWSRLLFQPVYILWVWWAALRAPQSASTVSAAPQTR